MIRLVSSALYRFRLISIALLILIAAVALTFTVLAVNKRRLSDYQSSASLSASATSINVVQSPSPEPRGQAQIVHFTLYDVGIFPSEARANPGLVAIYIDDLSGDTQGLVIEREGQRLGQVTRAQNRSRGRARIALGRGVYRVYDAGRPANRATLIVEP